MENKMNKKINAMAKAGRIITTIVAVFTILGAAVIASGIGLAASLPSDALAVEVTGTADVTAKGEVLQSISKAIIDSSKGGEGKIMLGNSNVAIGDVEDSVPEGVAAKPTENGLTLSVNKKQLNLNMKAVIMSLVFTLINTICCIIVLFMVRSLMKSLEGCETPFCDDVIKKMKRFGFSLIPLAVFSGTSENVWETLLTVGAKVHMGIDLSVIFGILVVFMLVMVFSYGAELQKQSDETL